MSFWGFLEGVYQQTQSAVPQVSLVRTCQDSFVLREQFRRRPNEAWPYITERTTPPSTRIVVPVI
jgi:hypothetical protein